MTHSTPDLSASNSLPAIPRGKDVIVRDREPVPQREDYVPPAMTQIAIFMGVFLKAEDALAIHKFIKVNAVWAEDKKLADDLGKAMEGRS